MAAGMPVSTAVAAPPMGKVALGSAGKLRSDLQGLCSSASQTAVLQPGAALFFAKLQAMVVQNAPSRQAGNAAADATLLETPDGSGTSIAEALSPAPLKSAQALGKASAPSGTPRARTTATSLSNIAADGRANTASAGLKDLSAKKSAVPDAASALVQTSAKADAGTPREKELHKGNSAVADASASFAQASAPAAPTALAVATASEPVQGTAVVYISKRSTTGEELASIAGETGNNILPGESLAGLSSIAALAPRDTRSTSPAKISHLDSVPDSDQSAAHQQPATAASTQSNPTQATSAHHGAPADTAHSPVRSHIPDAPHAIPGSTSPAQATANPDEPGEVHGCSSALTDATSSQPAASPVRPSRAADSLTGVLTDAIHPDSNQAAARGLNAAPQVAPGAEGSGAYAQGDRRAAHEEPSTIGVTKPLSAKTAAQHASSSVAAQNLSPAVPQLFATASVRENPIGTQAVPVRTGDSAHAAAAAQTPRGADVFAALDGDSAPAATWVHAGPQRAEAGYLDPSLGWVGVRAEVSANALHANIVPATAEAAQMLNTHLAGLNAYMVEHHAAAVSMGTPDTSAWGSGAHAGQGMGHESASADNAGRGSAQQSSHDATPSVSSSIGRARQGSTTTGIESGVPAMRSGATISLMA